MLIDIAQRGRSLGVLLVGAQQTASRVAPEVLENAAIRVSGRLDAAEAERAEYGWMLPVHPRPRAAAEARHDGGRAARDPRAARRDLPLPAVGDAEGGGGRPTPAAIRSRVCSRAPPMRILHTADWHVGRRLGRHDRMPTSTAAVLDEVAAIADAARGRPRPRLRRRLRPARPARRRARARARGAPASRRAAARRRGGRQPRLARAVRRARAAARGTGRVHLIGAIRRPTTGGLLGPDELGVARRRRGVPVPARGTRRRLHARHR